MDSRSSGAQPSMEGLGLGGPCHNASPELSENQLSSQDQGRCCALILGIFQQAQGVTLNPHHQEMSAKIDRRTKDNRALCPK